MQAIVSFLGACLLASSAAATAPPGTTDASLSQSGQQSIEVNPSASTIKFPTLQAFGKSATAPTIRTDDYESRIKRIQLMRRDSGSVPTASHADWSGDDHPAADAKSEPAPTHNSLKEDDEFTPEAIFANKKLAPEIAEFLGHLAQSHRVHRKEEHRAAQEAGLLAQGTGHMASPADKDDSDDIEDMKKSAAKAQKSTPLSHFFERLDSKAKAAAWLESDCAAMAQNITEKYQRLSGRSGATWGSVGPASAASRSEIHTGMFFHHWSVDKMKDTGRKLRLGVLSFLATQDPAKVKLHIWTDLDKHDKKLTDMLGPIAHHAELMDAINITTFDPTAEFAKNPSTYTRDILTDRYKKNSMPELKADLFRSVILYNYGGLWMDADTVLLQDVAPLLGEDWAHLVKGKEGAVEGALLSTSRPKSHFANTYLINMVMRDASLVAALGPRKPLLAELFNNDPSHTTFHVLPPCFLDSEPITDAAVLSSDATVGSAFFGKAVKQTYRQLFNLGIQDAVRDNATADVSVLQESQPTEDSEQPEAPRNPTWAYHWRGNFAAPWAHGSFADVAERTFMMKLQIKHKHH